MSSYDQPDAGFEQMRIAEHEAATRKSIIAGSIGAVTMMAGDVLSYGNLVAGQAVMMGGALSILRSVHVAGQHIVHSLRPRETNPSEAEQRARLTLVRE